MDPTTSPHSISMEELLEYLSGSETVLNHLTKNISDLITGELIKRGILVIPEINISLSYYNVAAKVFHDTKYPKINIYCQPFNVVPGIFRSVELEASSSFTMKEAELEFEVNVDCLCTMHSKGYHLIPLFSLYGIIDKQGKVKEPKIDLRY